jgi:bifunctional DNA-binding transcriptional regulator/antitoxin component of YhaV-PrlF toxin-antitoxin module
VKRFDFPLERVRRWRSEQASLEELKLQQLRAEKGRLESVQRGLEAAVSGAENRVLAQPAIEAVELTSLGSYRTHTRQKIRELQNRGRQHDAKIVEQLQRVMEARRQAELLEQLRGKALGEWQTALDKEQEDLASELFLAKSRRN